MRKFFTLALLAFVLAAGVAAFTSIGKPIQALACADNNC